MEKVTLAQILTVLQKHPITFMAPLELNTQWYELFCRDKANVHIERFNWKGYEGYSQLHTSPKFYQRFLRYDYILVCHLDAFVFRDELEKWCRLNYDYIGSVIYRSSWNNGMPTLMRRVANHPLLKKFIRFSAPEYYSNGGFALKKVSTFHRITSMYQLYINLYHGLRKIRKVGFLEDVFITQHFPRMSLSFKIPPREIAQHFGAECVEYNENELPFSFEENNSLPFGIHGWIQFQKERWIPCIRKFGHLV